MVERVKALDAEMIAREYALVHARAVVVEFVNRLRHSSLQSQSIIST
jgi:hypothetical protein